MKRLDKPESAAFLNCRVTLFLKDPFFQIIHTGKLVKNSRTFQGPLNYYYGYQGLQISEKY